MRIYIGNWWKAFDRLLAATLGKSGLYTVSAECFIDDRHIWRLIRITLEWKWPDHCMKSARKEGLI